MHALLHKSALTLCIVVGLSSAYASPTSLDGISNLQVAERANSGPYQVINKSLKALGGHKALENVNGVTYQVPSMYRSQSLMQSYNMMKADVYISIEGSQNISFSYLPGMLRQRIDRRFTRSEYWYFATPKLEPVEFSLVVQDGNRSFASYVRGSNDVFADPTHAAGYQDEGLVQYLSHAMNAFSPKLLVAMSTHTSLSLSSFEIQPKVFVPAVYDPALNLTVLFDPDTHLPYIVRTHEYHYVYGPSTRDIQLTQYKQVSGVMFPHRILAIFNNESVIEDIHIAHVEVNPQFPAKYFSGTPIDEQGNEAPPPIDMMEYTQSEIGEAYDNMLWDGPYRGTYNKIIASHPLPELPTLWHLMFPDAVNYENLVVEFDDGVMVLDAPLHQSKLIIKWVHENIGKPITRIWPTHHHHDHSAGVKDFTALGATLVIPAVAAPYWSIAAPNSTKVITYNDTHPWIHHDKRTQVRLLWEQQAVHALDWSYAVVASACPSGPGDGIVAFEADAWSPGTDATRFDVNFARQWLRQAERDGLSADARVVAVHGGNKGRGTSLRELIEVAGYRYPELNTTSWRKGGEICLT